MLTEILEANGEKTEILEANGKKEERKRERERKREDMYCRYVWNVLKGQKRDPDLNRRFRSGFLNYPCFFVWLSIRV